MQYYCFIYRFVQSHVSRSMDQYRSFALRDAEVILSVLGLKTVLRRLLLE